MVSESSWFRHLWRTPPRKHQHDNVLGVLAFEVAGLMSKLLHLSQSLSDNHILRLREHISNSVGIRKLVSAHDDDIARLVCAEFTENMAHLARAVARLGTKCNDTGLKNFQHLFNDLINTGFDPNGWEFSWKKMERKTNKMARYISLNASMYQEIEILTDLQQTLKRMKASNNNHDSEGGGLSLLEFEKRVTRKQQEVNNLKAVSLWNKPYDYALLLLARSLFTIFARIRHLFGGIHPETLDAKDTSRVIKSHYNPSSLSTLMMQSADHQSPIDISRYASGPLPKSRTVETNNFYSGPLRSTTAKTGLGSGTNKALNFYSGPLGKQKPKSSPFSGTSKTIQRLWQRRDNPTAVQGKNLHTNPNRLASVSSPLSISSNHTHSGILGRSNTDECFAKLSIFSPKRRLLDAPADTLGGAALALHYSNVIIVIERLVASPHLIGHDARDDLYNMLPARVRTALREKLKPYAKNLTSSLYDTALAGEWNEAMAGILEWLAPLAHNMIRWQSERSFEQQNFVSKTNVLLVQTLYFANQEKTEATIIELLVGLNYIWRFGRELNAKALLECPGSKIFDQYLDLEG